MHTDDDQAPARPIRALLPNAQFRAWHALARNALADTLARPTRRASAVGETGFSHRDLAAAPGFAWGWEMIRSVEMGRRRAGDMLGWWRTQLQIPDDQAYHKLVAFSLGELSVLDLFGEDWFERSLPAFGGPFRRFEVKPRDFPTLRGRDQALRQVLDVLRGRAPESSAGRHVRWLSLIGPGGIGKTSLALKASWELSRLFHGVPRVSLEQISSAAELPAAVALVLGIEAPGQTPEGVLELIAAPLNARGTWKLLLLDNCEHVRDAMPWVAQLLEAVPGLLVLATSQATLHVPALLGMEIAVEALPIPAIDASTTDADLRAEPAIQLFMDSVPATLSGTPIVSVTGEHARAIARAVGSVGGNPLAIRIIAATVNRRLGLSALTRAPAPSSAGLPPARRSVNRHASLADTLAWTYQHLEPGLVALHEDLCALQAPLTARAACAIIASVDQRAPADVEQDFWRLGEWALIERQVTPEDDAPLEPHFVTQLALRGYAEERLAARAPERISVLRGAHASYFAHVAQDANAQLYGPHQAQALERLRPDDASFEAAVGWARTTRSVALALELCGALWRYWTARGLFARARDHLEGVLALVDAASPPSVALAETYHGLGVTYVCLGKYDAALRTLDTAADTWHALSPERAALAISHQGWALHDAAGDDASSSTLERARQRFDRAYELLEREEARGVDVSFTKSVVLVNRAMVALQQANFQAAVEGFQDALSTLAEAGGHGSPTWWQLTQNLGFTFLELEDWEMARSFLESAVGTSPGLAPLLTGRLEANAYANWAWYQLAAPDGDLTIAAGYFARALARALEMGERRLVLEYVTGVACLQAARGGARDRDAARLFGLVERLRSAWHLAPTPVEQRRAARAVTGVRDRLGAARWQADHTSGTLLSQDAGIRLALGLAEWPIGR